MKKNVFNWFGVIAITAVIALGLASCDSGTNPATSPSPGGGDTSGVTPPSDRPPLLTVRFNAVGGSAVESRLIRQGATMLPPANPVRALVTPGLYAGEFPGYTFAGWQLYTGEIWDFTQAVTRSKTLSARWTPPAAVNLDLTGTNIVSAAVAHANANAGAFTLFLDENVNSGANALTQPDTNLTIIGLGEPREIRFTATAATGRLFDVGATNAISAVDTISLTLGNNITLVGRDNHENDLVRVQNGGNLIMQTGSKITGHTNIASVQALGLGAAVLVDNLGTFSMSSGSITGNHATDAQGTSGGGVRVNADGNFIMTGGSVQGNTTGNDLDTDVFLVDNTSLLTISQTAAIGNLTLGTPNNDDVTTRSFVSIDSSWIGSIGVLNLCLSANMPINTFVIRWIVDAGNNPIRVLRAAGNHTLTTADVGRVGMGRLTAHNAENSVPMTGAFIGTGEAAGVNAPNGFMIANSGAHIGGFIVAP